MATEADYIELTRKVTSLDRRRAVLESQEEAKTRERDTLLSKLKELGIDPEKIDDEIKRLEALVEKDFSEHQTKVDEFEKQLTALEGGVVQPTPPPPAEPPVQNHSDVEFE